MSYSEPARIAARRTRVTVYGRRRRRLLLGAVVALLLAYTAFLAPGHPPDGNAPPHRDETQSYAAAVRWPQQGQAALTLGDGRPAASPNEQPVPIASLAKVMTAYLTLQHYPLSDAQDGFTITVTSSEAQATAEAAAQRQSVVALRAGERLTERQLLEALLVPSGNNIAWILAAHLAGSGDEC
jgi:D-alanyl-D-alanine carboxypeptidase (penicillin-binding protein 5/6)